MSHQSRQKTVRRGITLAAAVVLLASGCAALSSAVGELGDLAGVGGNDGVAVQTLKSLSAVADAATSPFTPEQEYYVGRSVAATILRDYAPYENSAVNDYVNRLGQSLALASQRPVLYHGYTFLVLDHDEINAFATPGGHIFITRGMLALTESEDELAAVLAHEIGHVAMRHGLGSIRNARVIGAVQDGMFDALDTLSGQELAEVTAVFGDTTADIVDTLATRGYSGATERQADAAAVNILLRVGYDPYALVRVLERMDAAQQAQYEGGQEKQGFSKTHPRPQSRILDLEQTDLRNVEAGSRVDDAESGRRFGSTVRSF
ncbi:MAG TPA: M48 family metalloprotease [Spirochaetia bacterium]|nr:M48 family metalloprotease [Spirochaetia bacterium]